MSKITKYMVTGLGIDLANNSIIAGYAEVTDCEQPICMWSDVEPIVQRNKELETELARLREQKPIECLGGNYKATDGVGHSVECISEHGKTLCYDPMDTPGNRNPEFRYAGYKGYLLQDNATDDQILAYKEGVRARCVIPDTNTDTDPKPAQEIPAELVGWANSWQEDDSDMTDYLVGCNDMAHFVKSQLVKMSGERIQVATVQNAEVEQRQVDIVEFINTFPELNMSDYSDYDVEKLNAWGIEIWQMVKGKS